MNLNYSSTPRILVLSHRQINSHVSRAFHYELEDVIAQIDRVDLVSYQNSFQFARRINNLANSLTKLPALANLITPNPNPLNLEQDYEILFIICAGIRELFALNSLQGNWRQRCNKAICYVTELWHTDIDKYGFWLEPLKQFDYTFLGAKNTIETVKDLTGKPCTHLPFGIDAIKFCPFIYPTPRSIDICSIGRRSSITHQALMELTSQGNFHYHYDTIDSLWAINIHEHRSLIANVLKRSRYFIANRAKVNNPDQTGGNEELGPRFFEGAASGAIMIGEHPTTEEFYEYFDWQDAVIRVPFDAPDIGNILKELDSQTERLERIRRDNVVNSLLRHDFVYRWEKILEVLGLEITQEMEARKEQLKCLADKIAVSN